MVREVGVHDNNKVSCTEVQAMDVCCAIFIVKQQLNGALGDITQALVSQHEVSRSTVPKHTKCAVMKSMDIQRGPLHTLSAAVWQPPGFHQGSRRLLQ